MNPFKRRRIYLASQSARRYEYLKKMGISFAVVPSRYRETDRGKRCPAVHVMDHALGKASHAILPKPRHLRIQEIILGADTIVYFKGKILGKPKTMVEAKRILRTLNGKSHRVYSGLALLDRKTGQYRVAYEKTTVRFKKWSPQQIGDYLNRINPLDKAGAYAIQMRPNIVVSYRGSYSNVVGFPVELFRKMFKSFPR